MTEYTNFLKLRAQAFNDSNWDVLLNQNFSIIDFVAGAQNSTNRLRSGGVVTAGTGLNADYPATVVEVGGVPYAVAAASIAVSASSLNFVYVNNSGAVVVATSPPSGDYIPLAVVDAGASSIDRVGDCRPLSPVSIPGENIIINGGMRIDQVNNGAAVSVSTTAAYFLDMIKCSAAVHAAVVNAQRITGFGGFSYAARLAVTTADTLAADESGHGFLTYIEYSNCQRIADRSLHLKFKFKATVPGTYSVALLSGDRSNSYVTTFSYPSAWAVQDVSLLIPVPTAKIVDSTNNRGLILYIGVAGTGTKATATLDQWQAVDCVAASTSTDWETTIGNYIAVTGLYAAVDLAPAEFPFRHYGEELSLCQRYLLKSYNTDTIPGTITTTGSKMFVNNTGGLVTYCDDLNFTFPVEMRTTATVTIYSQGTGASNNAYNVNTSSDVAISSIVGAGSSGFGGFVTSATVTAAHKLRLHYLADARM